MNTLTIYKKLLNYFGPQGWWPIFNTKAGECAYHCSEKHRQLNCFEICIGAILTQNTAWKNVERALFNLSLRGARRRDNLSPQFILSCKKLEQLIKPAGYYNQKAKKLRIFSEWWIKNHHSLSSLSLVSCRLSLLSLWGIGPETADSILLYAFNKPIFVIDAYTKRLCKEFGVEFKTYDEYRIFFESQLPKSSKLFNEYHALIVAWGKLYAKDKKTAKQILDIGLLDIKKKYPINKLNKLIK